MFTFTFDEVYFFDLPSNCDPKHGNWSDSGCWYAYTHPKADHFCHGSFFAKNGLFSEGPNDGRGFDKHQIKEIEQILKTNVNVMNPKQFEAHLIRPGHYLPIDRPSSRFTNFIDKVRFSGREDPEVSVAFEKFTSENRAYRLTRGIVRRILQDALLVTPTEFTEWLDNRVRDTWIYDYGPEPDEKYEDFYEKEYNRLYVPDYIKKEITPNTILYEIEGLPTLYMLEEVVDNEFLNTQDVRLSYFIDLGLVIAPVSFPDSYYIL
jgi:hypothetical protein